MAELYSNSLFSDANLQAYWRFEGNSNDSKGSNNGTDTSITYNASYGKFGQGALFNGSSSKIVIADATAVKPTGAFTLNSWVKMDGTASVSEIFQTWSWSTNLAGILFEIDSLGRVYCISAKNTGNPGIAGTDYVEIRSTGNTYDGNWHMVTATYDGTNIRLYIDTGADGVSGNYVGGQAYAVINYVRIGCRNDSGTDNSFFDGDIDDLALFNRVLNTTEIASLFASGVSRHFNKPTLLTLGVG